LVDLAVRAEAAGWDGIFLWDHVLAGDMAIADTWTTLAAIAASTTSIRLGPMVTPLPRRRPWIVARQAATVSTLSKGRVVLGLGLGVDETGDLSRFGDEAPMSVRREMLEEGIGIVRSMWNGLEVEHDGQHYRAHVPAAPANPYPLRIWMGSSTARPGVLARAAKCDGIFHNPEHDLTPDGVRKLIDDLADTGMTPGSNFDVAVRGNASSAWPAQHDVDLGAFAEAGATWWLESLIHFDPLAMSQEVVDAGPPRR
jgi:alkanesulfonate monooxygenase SsuD/methylene tetrahydromethanopterin reductase-like flavin-dependent oxidoreductase (luciferase family)